LARWSKFGTEYEEGRGCHNRSARACERNNAVRPIGLGTIATSTITAGPIRSRATRAKSISADGYTIARASGRTG